MLCQNPARCCAEIINNLICGEEIKRFQSEKIKRSVSQSKYIIPVPDTRGPAFYSNFESFSFSLICLTTLERRKLFIFEKLFIDGSTNKYKRYAMWFLSASKLSIYVLLLHLSRNRSKNLKLFLRKLLVPKLL